MLLSVLSTDVSVVEHMLKGGKGALFRIPANAMQLKGTQVRCRRYGRRGTRKAKAVVPSGVWCPLNATTTVLLHYLQLLHAAEEGETVALFLSRMGGLMLMHLVTVL